MASVFASLFTISQARLSQALQNRCAVFVDRNCFIAYTLRLSSQGKVSLGLMRTYVPKGREAEALTVGANWFVIDANGQVLGRLATRVARLLIGKDKPNYTPYLDSGDHVVVINAERIKLTGNKIEQKVYRRHSGYPGGLKEIPIRLLMQRRPEEVVREAVLGMLPKNKLRARRARKLRVYVGNEALTRHAGQKPQLLAQ